MTSEKGEQVTIVPIDTALFEYTRVTPVDSVVNCTSMWASSRIVSTGFLMAMTCATRERTRAYIVRQAFVPLTRTRSLILLVIPTEYIDDTMFRTIVDSCKCDLQNKRVVVAGVCVPARFVVRYSGFTADSAREALASLSNINSSGVGTDTLAALSTLWNTDLSAGTIVSKCRPLQKAPSMMTQFKMLFEKCRATCVPHTSAAMVYCSMKKLWKTHWMFCTQYLDDVAADTLPVSCSSLAIVLMYWRAGVNVRISAGARVKMATCLSVLFSRITDPVCADVCVTDDWARQQGRVSHELARLANVAVDTTESSRVKFAHRLSNLFEAMPHIAWLPDIQVVQCMVSAIEQCCFGHRKPTIQGLLYAYLLYLQVPHTTLTKIHSEVTRLLFWTTNSVFSEDRFIVQIPSQVAVSKAVQEFLARTPYFDTDIRQVNMPTTLWRNPMSTTALDARFIKRLFDFAYLFVTNLFAKSGVQSGMTQDKEWLVVPIFLMTHNNTTPGGTASIHYMDFPPGWVKFGEMKYMAHVAKPLTKKKTATTTTAPDKKDICSSVETGCFHETTLIGKKVMCEYCGKELQETSTTCVAIQRYVLAGGEIFYPRLAYCAYDILLKNVAAAAATANTGNKKKGREEREERSDSDDMLTDIVGLQCPFISSLTPSDRS